MGSAKPPGALRPLRPATPRPLGREGGREGAREGTRQSPGPSPAGARPAAGGGRRRERPRSAALPLAARGAAPGADWLPHPPHPPAAAPRVEFKSAPGAAPRFGRAREAPVAALLLGAVSAPGPWGARRERRGAGGRRDSLSPLCLNAPPARPMGGAGPRRAGRGGAGAVGQRARAGRAGRREAAGRTRRPRRAAGTGPSRGPPTSASLPPPALQSRRDLRCGAARRERRVSPPEAAGECGRRAGRWGPATR